MLGTWSLGVAIAVLVGCAIVTVVGGVRLAQTGEVLASRVAFGQALFGAVFFGAVISLSGIVMTATAGAQGMAQLAFSNAVGGVAAQTAMIGVADMVYRKANLEHAAASLPNMLFTTVLMAMLTIVLIVPQTPDWTLFAIHPATPLLLIFYVGGLKLVKSARDEPLWHPERTAATVDEEGNLPDAHEVDDPDDPDEVAEAEANQAEVRERDVEPMKDESRSTASVAWRFAVFGVLVAAGGYGVARASGTLVEVGGLEQSLVGAAIMGLTNAMPELVTSVAAVRRGAVGLAVGGILGGNALDTLNVAIGDVAYRGGSVYHAAESDELLMTQVSLLLTIVVLAGLLRRQRHGPANVGFEGLLLFGLYIGALLMVGLG